MSIINVLIYRNQPTDLLCKAMNWFPYEEISDELSTQRLR